MQPQPLCRFLTWDTEFFGRRIGQLNVARLTASLWKDAVAWCRSQRIACLYFLADPQDQTTVRLAEANRFHLVDLRMEYVWRGTGPFKAQRSSWTDLLRPSRAEDVPALREIARLNHRDSRFYFDGHFSPRQCDGLYETWIARSCQGYADRVWVAENGGRPAGYISCHRLASGQGRIGLVGVAKEFQHQGLGNALVQQSLAWFASQDIHEVLVATQARNVAAQRLYQRCAFVLSSAGLWYHRWFNKSINK